MSATGHLVDLATACTTTGPLAGLPFPDCNQLAAAGQLSVGLMAGSVCGLPDDAPDYLPRQPLNDPPAKPTISSRCSKNGAGLPVFGTAYVQPQNYENFRFNAFEAPLPPRK